jgi:ankyrin repeat protein
MMETLEALPYHAPLEAYAEQAHALWSAFKDGDDNAAWRFKWEHPRFRGKPVTEVKNASLKPEDAELVVAQMYAFDTWRDLEAFTRALKTDPEIEQFESAVQAVVDGDQNRLKSALHQHPKLVKARSSRRHHATLLHYTAANGVEGSRQRTPPNAVEIATCLLDAGAEADALADMYGGKCTTLGMLVSSGHPAEAGVQAPLAELLLDHGANPEGAGSQKQSPVLIALAFGYSDTAQALARRAPPQDDLVVMAGLGRTEVVSRLLPKADDPARQKALALAALHGHTDVVKQLLDAGGDPNRYNPNGFHPHSTPLHQAVWSNHADTVRLLVERGARLDIRDKVYDGTPLDWAIFGKRAEIADYLRQHHAP